MGKTVSAGVMDQHKTNAWFSYVFTERCVFLYACQGWTERAPGIRTTGRLYQYHVCLFLGFFVGEQRICQTVGRFSYIAELTITISILYLLCTLVDDD